MINASYLLGYPVEFKKLFLVYPPLIKDVVGGQHFTQYLSVLTTSQEEVEDLLVEAQDSMEQIPTPLEFLLSNAYHSKEFEKIAKDAFEFFIHQSVTFLYEVKAILVGDLNQIQNIKRVEDLTLIDENNYFDFQNMIRECAGGEVIEPPNLNEDPRIKRIKAKARYRDKIKAKKGMGISLGTSLGAICCMNLGINPLNIGELSYAALHYLMGMYQDKERYQMDVESILAGADSKKIKPVYWIKN